MITGIEPQLPSAVYPCLSDRTAPSSVEEQGNDLQACSPEVQEFTGRSGGPRRDPQVYGTDAVSSPPRPTPSFAKEGWGRFCRSDVRCADPCRSGGPRRDPQVYGTDAVSSPPRPNPPSLKKEGWGGFCRSGVRCTDPCRSGGPRRDSQVYGTDAVSSPAAILKPLLWKRRVGVDFAGAMSDVQTLVGAAVSAAIPRSMARMPGAARVQFSNLISISILIYLPA